MALALVLLGQTIQSIIHGHQICTRFRGDHWSDIQRNRLCSATALMRLPGAGLVSEDAPHLPRTKGKEMGAVLPVNQLQIGKAQVKLIDQRSSLESVAATFARHAAPSCPV